MHVYNNSIMWEGLIAPLPVRSICVASFNQGVYISFGRFTVLAALIRCSEYKYFLKPRIIKI